MDWIGSFRATISELYAGRPDASAVIRSPVDRDPEAASLSQPLVSSFLSEGGSVSMKNLFTMADYLFLEVAKAHGVSWEGGERFVRMVMLLHVLVLL